MSSQAPFRWWLFALAVSAAAVGLSMAYVDRPLAEFLEGHIQHTEFSVWLEIGLRPIALIVVAALFFLGGCGVWAISGHPLRAWTEMPLLYSWATIWAVAIEIALKRIFGRSWPNPIFVQGGLYGFHFLHGQTYWDSFPSGTTSVSVAILSVLWIVKPRWRAAGFVIAILLSIAVVTGNYHWLSDVIAGAFVGVTVGWSTVRLLRGESVAP